jgi:hypothetical protein
MILSKIKLMTLLTKNRRARKKFMGKRSSLFFRRVVGDEKRFKFGQEVIKDCSGHCKRFKM